MLDERLNGRNKLNEPRRKSPFLTRRGMYEELASDTPDEYLPKLLTLDSSLVARGIPGGMRDSRGDAIAGGASAGACTIMGDAGSFSIDTMRIAGCAMASCTAAYFSYPSHCAVDSCSPLHGRTQMPSQWSCASATRRSAMAT